MTGQVGGLPGMQAGGRAGKTPPFNPEDTRTAPRAPVNYDGALGVLGNPVIDAMAQPANPGLFDSTRQGMPRRRRYAGDPGLIQRRYQ